jgi:IS5 family transposase
MTNNLIIPETLAPITTILNQYLQPLLAWFTQYVLERLLFSNRDHPLIRLQALMDFSDLEQACTPFHDQSATRGRPITHSVPRLLRALFIKYWYDLSLRRLEERLRNDMLVRWFVGCGLHQATPDHTTLHRFETYLYREYPSLFFTTLLKQIDATIDDGHDKVQIADTFALRANAAFESLLQRLRHSSYCLLQAWHLADPAGYAAAYPQLDEQALFGLKTEKRDFLLASDEWQQRLLVTVQAIADCLALLPPVAQRPPAVQQQVQVLGKIMADELAITYDENGRLCTCTRLARNKRGKQCSFSVTDPEASVRNHGPDKVDDGFNISVAATPDLIREIRADSGSTGDVVPIPDLLTAQAERGDALPEKLLYDQVAGNGKTAHLVDAASNSCTQLVAKPKYPKKSATFSPEDFTLSDGPRAGGGWQLTCPHGRISFRRYRSGEGDGWKFRFLPAQCLACPLRQQCRGSDKTPTTHRDVFINDYRADFDRLVAYSQTDDFKLDMKLRPQVERVIAGLVLHNGARYARFRGLAKVDFQVKMCAMIYNAKRWLVLLAEKEGQRKRPVRRRWQLPTPAPSLPGTG